MLESFHYAFMFVETVRTLCRCQCRLETVIIGSSAVAEDFLLLGGNRLVLFHSTTFTKFKEYLTIASLRASKHLLAWVSPKKDLENR